MNEDTNAPKIENEQKTSQQIIPTWAGILIVVALVGAFIFFFWKYQKENEINKQIEARAQSTVQIQKKTPATSETAPTSGMEANPADSAPQSSDDAIQSSGSNIDVDYELKKMDESADSVNENDFNSNNFSDAQIGI